EALQRTELHEGGQPRRDAGEAQSDGQQLRRERQVRREARQVEMITHPQSAQARLGDEQRDGVGLQSVPDLTSLKQRQWIARAAPPFAQTPTPEGRAARQRGEREQVQREIKDQPLVWRLVEVVHAHILLPAPEQSNEQRFSRSEEEPDRARARRNQLHSLHLSHRPDERPSADEREQDEDDLKRIEAIAIEIPSL